MVSLLLLLGAVAHAQVVCCECDEIMLDGKKAYQNNYCGAAKKKFELALDLCNGCRCTLDGLTVQQWVAKCDAGCGQTSPAAPTQGGNAGGGSGFTPYTETANGVSFKMITITGGTFTMGCTSEQQDCYDAEKPTHSVTLTSYYMGETEVTQALWRAVMGTDPSNFKGDNLPVENISWDDAQAFLAKLNTLTGKRYVLPTEAQWEFAAREGGKAVLFGNGKNTADPSQMNFYASAGYKKPYSVVGEYRQKTTAVKTFSPNALGLYDMSGNVFEWCADWRSDYPAGAQTNPTGPATGSFRVVRGGSWGNYPRGCRVANRNNYSPTYRGGYLGFRVVRLL